MLIHSLRLRIGPQSVGARPTGSISTVAAHPWQGQVLIRRAGSSAHSNRHISSLQCASTADRAGNPASSLDNINGSADGCTWTIHTRTYEQEFMVRELSLPPYKVIVMCGPPGCDQAGFLHQMSLQPGTMSAFLDCSRANCSTPRNFATSLAMAVLAVLVQDQGADQVEETLNELVPQIGWPLLMPAITALQLSYTIPDFNALGDTSGTASSADTDAEEDSIEAAPSPAVMKALWEATPVEAVRVLMRALTRECSKRYPDSPLTPRLYMSGAHALLAWQSSNIYAAQLKELGALFTYMAEDAGALHVVLASSDFCLLNSMRTALGIGRWHTVVLGYLPQPDARALLIKCLYSALGNSHRHLCDVPDAQWAKLYKMVGGNPEDIQQAATSYVRWNCNWDAARESLRRQATARLEYGLSGASGYTGREFAAAAVLLLENEGLVRQLDMELCLGKASGKALSQQLAAGSAILVAMVEDNLLHMRPYSRMARDVSLLDLGYLVTAVSPLCYHCMERNILQLYQRR